MAKLVLGYRVDYRINGSVASEPTKVRALTLSAATVLAGSLRRRGATDVRVIRNRDAA